jgi:acetolactate decarboxylase
MSSVNPEISSPIYLCAPVNALVEGLYEQPVAISELAKHGDFGIGTFSHLDGEMIVLDGEVFRVDHTGKVSRVDEDVLTPFACVTRFRALSFDEICDPMDYTQFLHFIDRLLPSPNIFYALRIEGSFSHVRTRSVPRQENYRPLAEVAKEQPTFEFEDVEGVLVGFYTPVFLSSLNVPGLHLHFLSADRTRGGHLLECRPVQGTAGVQLINRLELSLPIAFDYLTLDFKRDTEADLGKAEK